MQTELKVRCHYPLSYWPIIIIKAVIGSLFLETREEKTIFSFSVSKIHIKYIFKTLYYIMGITIRIVFTLGNSIGKKKECNKHVDRSIVEGGEL